MDCADVKRMIFGSIIRTERSSLGCIDLILASSRYSEKIEILYVNRLQLIF